MNVHPGQGTACRRLYFDNSYLELIWLADREVAASRAIERTCLAARAGREGGASRLGVAVRPQGNSGVAPPVDTWSYQPPYLPEGVAIAMACNSTVVREPLLFFMPPERQRDAPRVAHPNGAMRVTGISLMLPWTGPATPEMQWLKWWQGIQVHFGGAERLELELDHGAKGRWSSLAPAAPLEVTW